MVLFSKWVGVDVGKALQQELDLISELIENLDDIEAALENRWDRLKKLKAIIKLPFIG